MSATPERRSSLLALARKAGWNVADQALSSLSNLALSLLVARAVDEEAFGAFTVSFTVYSVAVLVSRSLASQPMMIRFAGVGKTSFRDAAGRSTGTAAVVGLASGIVVLVAGLALGGGVGTALTAMALLLPGLLVQDAWRMAYFSQRRPEMATVIDAVWMVLQIAAVAVFLAIGADSAVPYVIAWGLAAGAAALVGVGRDRVAPRVSGAWSWLKDHWGLTRYLVTEALLLQGAYQGALLLVGALGTLTDIGSLRGAQVVLGPVSLLAASAMAFAVPEISRRPGLSPRVRVLAAGALGAALSVGGLLWGIVMLLLPDAWGVELLGDSWDGVRTVLLASVIGQVGNLISVGPACVAYGLGRSDAVFRIHAAVSVMLVVFGVGGLWLGGAVGAAYGFALAYWAVVPFWFRTVARLSAERPVDLGAEPRADHVEAEPDVRPAG
jgi:O-antigen/teichoic acid export membrane protein